MLIKKSSLKFSLHIYASIPNDDSQTTQQRQNVMLYGLSVNDLFMDLNFWAYFDRFALKILIYSFNSVFFLRTHINSNLWFVA